MDRLAWLVLAALLELLGCFAFWQTLREGRSAWWLVPAVASLLGFATALTRVEVAHAGRAFAAYGGIYIAAALAWLVAVEGARPDRWDLLGSGVCILGAAIIVLAPR